MKLAQVKKWIRSVFLLMWCWSLGLLLAGEYKGWRIPAIMLMTLIRSLLKKADQFDDRPFLFKI